MCTQCYALWKRDLPVKEEGVNRPERHDAEMVRWMYNVTAEDKISTEDLKTRLKLKSRGECL